jgi:uncharacterized protein (UPF0147 family)
MPSKRLSPAEREAHVATIVAALRELEADASVPKNIRQRITTSIGTLQEQSQPVDLRSSRALAQLEEVAEDMNVQAFTRTQLFNIVSMLEITK